MLYMTYNYQLAVVGCVYCVVLVVVSTMMRNWAGVGGIVGIVYFAITMIDCYG